MSKKIILISLSLVVLLLLFIFIQKSTEDKNLVISKEQKNDSEIQVEPTLVVGKGSLDELLKLNQNLECVISYKVSTSTSEIIEGSYFTSNGKMRGDFLTKDNGKEILSSMIIKDDTFYSWTIIDGKKFGMRTDMKYIKESDTTSQQPKADNGPISLDQSVDYDCKPWNNVDGSIFEPPTDFVFRDFSSVMNTGMEYGNIYETDGIDPEEMIKQWESER